jgi:hypothetical protein
MSVTLSLLLGATLALAAGFLTVHAVMLVNLLPMGVVMPGGQGVQDTGARPPPEYHRQRREYNRA